MAGDAILAAGMLDERVLGDDRSLLKQRERLSHGGPDARFLQTRRQAPSGNGYSFEPVRGFVRSAGIDQGRDDRGLTAPSREHERSLQDVHKGFDMSASAEVRVRTVFKKQAAQRGIALVRRSGPMQGRVTRAVVSLVYTGAAF